ncbi:DUF3833 domain-containing protein [Hydrogenophaga sp.]|uniref:DUF3833 domain-containing protein n=1 Tax=Hydrogenophaga sp. TaxID=1904254 RepID=UPI002608679B|nr:DUF3833 domain-containing protein [Hydrogenophaga sp.]MCW5654952.1 DUF3833 domain-containing protein [Hydrogenophaga sp.]
MALQRRHILLAAGLAGTAALTAGCASPTVADYAGEKPELDLRRYFSGTLDAYGVFTDRAGRVARRFTVVMRCQWNGDDGVLDEDFTYSDGSTQKRIWRMKHLGEGRFSGTADDVVGQALGEQRGNAFRWTYTLRLPVEGTSYDVQFDDWMFLMDDRVMLNRAQMSKFGVRLGEVTLSFVKRTPP